MPSNIQKGDGMKAVRNPYGYCPVCGKKFGQYRHRCSESFLKNREGGLRGTDDRETPIQRSFAQRLVEGVEMIMEAQDDLGYPN